MDPNYKMSDPHNPKDYELPPGSIMGIHELPPVIKTPWVPVLLALIVGGLVGFIAGYGTLWDVGEPWVCWGLGK